MYILKLIIGRFRAENEKIDKNKNKNFYYLKLKFFIFALIIIINFNSLGSSIVFLG
jgi:hypothetical protein